MIMGTGTIGLLRRPRTPRPPHHVYTSTRLTSIRKVATMVNTMALADNCSYHYFQASEDHLDEEKENCVKSYCSFL